MNKDILYLAGLTETWNPRVLPNKHPEACGAYEAIIGEVKRNLENALSMKHDPEAVLALVGKSLEMIESTRKFAVDRGIIENPS